ncbi:hypothetical protein POM88_004103 [Heracleum sosnowskyi]|uniref:Uncharacterized protein n=1 Tax=Heracleum sosnowskyi TaxID=360622 RepID=A0AAD8JIQ4_9APIA|nr:hypothetical protein POM88_004103 [Heracleum sosnowskyi]
MSLTPRPRIVVNGVQRMRRNHYYWCPHCQLTIWMPTSQICCPLCLCDLWYEFDVSRPRLLLDVYGSSRRAAPAALDYLNLMFEPNSFSPFNLDYENRYDDIVLRVGGPPRPRRYIPPRESLHVHEEPEPSVDQLMEEVRPGPAPAPASVIERLPVLILTPSHLISDSHCPVLCRYELPADPANNDKQNDEDFIRAARNLLNWNWTQVLLSLWPFNLLSHWTSAPREDRSWWMIF